MHIPVAPACNIKCNYCYREVGSHDNRPGVSYEILGPREALSAVEHVVANDPSIHVIGVAGPGDALANEATFKSLKLIHEKFPQLKKCISTNGLLLPEKVEELVEVGVSTISVTLNAISWGIGRHFYKRVRFNGRTHYEDAFEVLSARQREGIALAVDNGLIVKINTVLVPELNLHHIGEIAQEMKRLGAHLMNIMPLKPIAGMSHYRAPNCLELEVAREDAEKHIEIFRLCKQCRADAIGIPGLVGNFNLGEHGHGGHGQPGKGCGSEPLGEAYMIPLYH